MKQHKRPRFYTDVVAMHDVLQISHSFVVVDLVWDTFCSFGNIFPENEFSSLVGEQITDEVTSKLGL